MLFSQLRTGGADERTWNRLRPCCNRAQPARPVETLTRLELLLPGACARLIVALMEIVKKLDFADISLHEPQNLRVQEVIQAVTEPSVERLAQYASSPEFFGAGRTLCARPDI